MSLSSSVQLSYNGVSAGRSIILLDIKCPQLSKLKARGAMCHMVLQKLFQYALFAALETLLFTGFPKVLEILESL